MGLTLRMASPQTHAEARTPSVTVSGGRAIGRRLGIAEVMSPELLGGLSIPPRRGRHQLHVGHVSIRL